MKRIICITAFCCIGFTLAAQPDTTGHQQALCLKTGYFQVKDAFNYGLVYQGFGLSGAYGYEQHSAGRKWGYRAGLSLGIDFNKGAGTYMHVKPAEVYHEWRLSQVRPVVLWAGPSFQVNYSWQLYPDLQSGHMFWYSAYEMGIRIRMDLPEGTWPVRIYLYNSIAGWTSRPVPSTETYYYSLRFDDFIRNVNSDLAFGSFGRFNHTRIQVEWDRGPGRRLSLAYAFEYVTYRKDPEFKFIEHALILKWKI